MSTQDRMNHLREQIAALNKELHALEQAELERTSPGFLSAKCYFCGWAEGIRADHWNQNSWYWCEECNCEQPFRLVAKAQEGPKE